MKIENEELGVAGDGQEPDKEGLLFCAGKSLFNSVRSGKPQKCFELVMVQLGG